MAAKAKPNPEYVIVIEGKEPTLVSAKCTELVNRLLAPAEKATGLWVADADKVTISDVLDEVRTLPFLTKRRVVELRNADKFISANREALEKYFEGPCPTGVLVMTVSTWQSNTRLARKLSEIGTLIKVEPPKGPELMRQLIAYAQDVHNKRLEYGVAELLVEIAGDDITRLKTEIDKLAAYTANEKTITPANIETLVGHNRLFDVFNVIDACLRRETGLAVERLRNMFESDKTAEYTTVGAFAYHFRRMFTAKKLLQEGLNEYEVAGKARIFYNKQTQFAQIRRLTFRQIGDQLKQLAEIDYAIKRGQAQPRIAIEQLVFQMAAM